MTQHADTAQPRKVALSFTGGKDSMLVLHLLFGAPPRDPAVAAELEREFGSFRSNAALVSVVTFIPKQLDADKAANSKPRFLSHPIPVIQAQLQAMNLLDQHRLVEIAGPDHLSSYAAALKALDIDALATGDILDVCNGFMRRAAERAGIMLWTPLWEMPRHRVWYWIHTLSMRVMVSCVNIDLWRKPDATQPIAQDHPIAHGNHASAQDAVDHAAATAAATAAAAAIAAARPSRAEHADAALRNSGNGTSHAVQNGNDTTAAAAGDADKTDHSNIAAAQNGANNNAIDCASNIRTVDQSHSAGQHAEGGLCFEALPHCLVGSELSRDAWEVMVRARDEMGVDECGEAGEYHTMVVDGPLFNRRVDIIGTRAVERNFCYLDVQDVKLLPKSC